ncbi:MAG: hypothetical protein WDN10_03555 [bacterium]
MGYIEKGCSHARARGHRVKKVPTRHGEGEMWLNMRLIDGERCLFYAANSANRVQMSRGRLKLADRVIICVVHKRKNHYIGLPVSLLFERIPEGEKLMLNVPKRKHGGLHGLCKHGIELWAHENEWTLPHDMRRAEEPVAAGSIVYNPAGTPHLSIADEGTTMLKLVFYVGGPEDAQKLIGL